MGDVLQFRPRQPASARDYRRMMERAFATFPVPTLARMPNDDLLAEIFGDAPVSEQRLQEIEDMYEEPVSHDVKQSFATEKGE